MSSDTESIKSGIFHFRQFDVVNRSSAMKVNTDGVLLGAWADCSMPRRVWDVGTGTGVIALMLAQRFPQARVDAFEIDSPSAREAICNFEASPWSDRLHLHEGDFLELCGSLPAPDLIVCNPPYFDERQHNLLSPSLRKATARHEDRLTYDALLDIAAKLLSADGRLCMVSPEDREDDIEWFAAIRRMSLIRKTYVSSTPAKKPKRILWCFGRGTSAPVVDCLSIRDTGGYSTEYVRLVRDFYINID